MLGILSKFLPFLSSGPGKMIWITTLLTTLTSFCVWGYNSIYEAGYNEASLLYKTEMVRKIEEELDKARTNWEIETDKAIALAKTEREVVEKVKTVYVDVYKTEYLCEDVGDNALELLNRVFDND